MSIVTTRVGGKSLYDAAYGWQNAAGSLTNLSCSGGNCDNRPNSLLSAEQKLNFGMLNDSLAYKAGLQQEESLKKLTDENIKRSFSVFA